MACASTSGAGDIAETAAISQNCGQRTGAWSVAAAASATPKAQKQVQRLPMGPGQENRTRKAQRKN